MPEIAEVETVRKTLLKQILHQQIEKVEIYYKPLIESYSLALKKLENEQFIDLKRKGKWLIFETDNYYLLSHLRMEGKYFLKKLQDPKEKHEHLIFHFKNKTDLRYHDVRKFGKMALITKDKLATIPALKKQGIEPNSPFLTKEYLYAKIQAKKISLKTLLLDQTIISGLGNIYANEILFQAKISPLREGNTLSLEDCQKIITATNKIIKEAIELGGTTIRSYTSSLGVTGKFQNNLKVHQKENKPCSNCQSLIIKQKINGRSAYFCPKCQK